MNDLYGKSVPSVALPTQLSNGDKTSFNHVSKAFEKAAEWLHAKKSFTPEMLSEPEPLALMNATHDVLTEELGHLGRNIPDEMARALDENIFLFSGFKTYHEMNDASRLLKDEDGGFKPFDRFLQDVQAIDAKYNQNYLYAEYNFATASTQMAAKWADIERDGDEYNLQYRTAMDGFVREEHAALESITLPPSDKFWNEYYPPNGWNCRCTAVQVLKEKYPTSDSDQACAAGERATTQIGKNGENKAAIFRFNPGKAGKVFPPKHPYYKAPAEVKKKVNAIVATMMTVTDPREAEYRRYKDDPNYRDVERNEKGGLKATHIQHNFDKKGGEYEKHVQTAGFNAGHSVILEAEPGTTYKLKYTEGLWDGRKFEVAGRETATENNVLRGLKHCASKQTTKIAVLDYPKGGFDQSILENAIKRYKGLEKLDDGQFVPFERIICVQNETIVFETTL